MVTLILYPETVQFRQVITHVTRHMGVNVSVRRKQLPTFKFIGTVKLHGTNAAIAYQQNIGHWYQSRNHVVTRDNDNAGFVQHMDSLAGGFFAVHVLPHCPIIREYNERGSTIVIYGEWCGGDIQGTANIAIANHTKMFVIFKIKIISGMKVSAKSRTRVEDKYKENPDEFWLDPKEWAGVKWHEQSIYNIYDFPTCDTDINFDIPERSQNTLTEITETIEQQCPVGAYFNRIGCGEGVVWTEWNQTHGCLTFKVKGREHSVINSKLLVPIRTLKLDSVQDFVEYACTKNRMQQAFNSVREELMCIKTKDFSTFLRWLTEDIVQEEKDTMDVAHIDAQDVTRGITSKAQLWFDNRLVQDRQAEKK